MSVSTPPNYSPAHAMKILKGKGPEYLRKDLPEFSKRYCGMHIWARWY